MKRNQHTLCIEVKGKRDKWRRIPHTEKASLLINRLQTLMMIEEVDSSYIAFSTKKTGNAMTYEALRLMTHKAVEFIAAETNSPPHWFRRAYITKLLSNGSPLIRVMEWVGHESINTTNEYLQSVNQLSNLTNSDLPFE